MEIASADDAEKFLRLYCLRWRIEDWHRVLKSGCRIEEPAHRTTDRLRSGLEEVAGELDSLVDEDPEQAADLYETFIAGCNEKAEEVDDSGGEPRDVRRRSLPLKRNHPEIAARLFCAMGMRIVNAKKSKYYGAALDNLGNAKRCYEKAGMDDAWAALVAEVREHHHRKYGFMPGFERLVAGSGPQ